MDCPARQGMWGIFEVFLSTLLVCTVTALVILVSGLWPLQGVPALSGAPLTAAAFSQVLGPVGQGVVALSLLLFAFSSILGWSYYGQQCLALSGGERPVSSPLPRCLSPVCSGRRGVGAGSGVAAGGSVQRPHGPAQLDRSASALAPGFEGAESQASSLTPDFTYILHNTGRTFYTLPSIIRKLYAHAG